MFLTFEGAAHTAEVYCNGTAAGSHACGYTAFSVDLTELLRLGQENVIVVKVDSRENQNIPPFGGVIDYMTYWRGQGDERKGFSVLAGIIAVFFVIAIPTTVCNVREKNTVEKQAVRVRDMFRALFSNDQALVVVAAIILFNASLYLTNQLSVYLATVLTTIFLADTVDYGEYKNGQRNESVTFSQQTFVVKLASAISALIAGVSIG